MAHVREMVALIKKGCGCKTGCQSSRCKRKRGGNYCFGCKCVGCCNLPTTPNRTVTEVAETQHDTEDEEDSEIESTRNSKEKLTTLCSRCSETIMNLSVAQTVTMTPCVALQRYSSVCYACVLCLASYPITSE